MIREARKIFQGMSAWEIVKLATPCVIGFILMWQLLFLIG